MLEKISINELLEIPDFLKEIKNDKIYHYASLDSFKNILDTKSLHLSHISSLNDYTEFEAGVQFFCNGLRSSEKNKQFEGLIETMESGLLQGKRNNFCVFSSCLDHDSLSQWRAYSDDGHGLAIGLDSKGIKAVCEQNDFYFGECFYSEESKREKMQNIVKGLIKHRDNKEHFIPFFIISVGLFALFFKNEHFEIEKEVRVATHPTITLDIKPRGNSMTPFYRLDIKDKFADLIKEVVIGPCSKSHEMFKVVETLLQKSGIKDCVISESSIPYKSIRTLRS